MKNKVWHWLCNSQIWISIIRLLIIHDYCKPLNDEMRLHRKSKNCLVVNNYCLLTLSWLTGQNEYDDSLYFCISLAVFNPSRSIRFSSHWYSEMDLLFLVPWARFPDCAPWVTDRRTTVSSSLCSRFFSAPSLGALGSCPSRLPLDLLLAIFGVMMSWQVVDRGDCKRVTSCNILVPMDR